jgi:hypothetical protein
MRLTSTVFATGTCSDTTQNMQRHDAEPLVEWQTGGLVTSFVERAKNEPRVGVDPQRRLSVLLRNDTGHVVRGRRLE